jgi:hypothetical protein
VSTTSGSHALASDIVDDQCNIHTGFDPSEGSAQDATKVWINVREEIDALDDVDVVTWLLCQQPFNEVGGAIT